MLGEKPPRLGQDEEVQQKTGKAEIAAKMEGLVMSWWKIAFCIAGYLFAWAAVAGFYDQAHKYEDDGLDGFGVFVGAAWPLYIAWIPLHAVYKAVKAQMLAQVERSKKAAEPSVPPGKFRIGSCETCMHAEPYDDGYMTCKACKDLGIARSTDSWCDKYESKQSKTENISCKWTKDEYAMALALNVMGYDTVFKMFTGIVHASGNGKDPFFFAA